MTMEDSIPCRQSGDHRMTAEEMDNQRVQSIGYEYLCRLEEAKRWLEAMLEEELPPTTELEESFRHGVHLARLALQLRPDAGHRMFDPQLTRYAARGLQFRHTDNINVWTQTMRDMGLPQTFIPTTTDVYERKNMPKTVYCIHALSLFVFQLGRGPQIQDLMGKAVFSAAEIDAVSAELQRYGLRLPTFSKIGGILAREMPVDKAALHAAVIVINEAIDRQNAGETLASLQNGSAHLRGVQPELADLYQQRLYAARRDKLESAANRSLTETFEADVYDELLTQAEIQGHVSAANRWAALQRVQDALELHHPAALHAALSQQCLQLQGVASDCMSRYLEGLKRITNGHPPSKEDVQRVITEVNQLAAHEQKEHTLVAAVNACLGSAADRAAAGRLLQLLAPLGLQPDALSSWAAPLFLQEMSAVRREQGADLTPAAVRGALRLLPALAAANAAVAAGQPRPLWRALSNPQLYIMDLDESCCGRYLSALVSVLERVRADNPDCPFITHQTLQQTVDTVNDECSAEDAKVSLIEVVNAATQSTDAEALLAALNDPALGYSRVSSQNIQLCMLLLRNMQETKRRGGDDDGVMWLEDIDECVRTALVDCELAQRACTALSEVSRARADALSAGRLLSLLQLPCLGLQDVCPSLAERYLSAVLRQRTAARHMDDKGDGGWVRHSVGGACEAYLQLDTGRVSWSLPDGVRLSTVHLAQAHLQAIVSETNASLERLRQERWLVPLQARCRGLLVRSRVRQRRQLYRAHLPQIVRIQAWWRGARQRRQYLVLRTQQIRARMTALQQEVDELKQRQQWEEQLLEIYRPYEAEIGRIQSWWRRQQQQRELRQLATAARPTVPLLRKFVHLLDVTGADFREEIQLQKLKGDVAQMIRKNQILEKDLDTLDVKIGLLVKNRITLQEVLVHSKSMDTRSKGVDKLGTLSRTQGLKALTRDARERLALYQQLFYRLQTRPEYLARLVLALPPGQSGRFLEQAVLSVFNYGANARQEFLLVKLFRLALQEEIRCRVESPFEVVTGNPLVVRMIVQYSRRHSLRPLLGPLVERVLADRTLNINTNPVEIYRHWVNQQETQTGQPCGLPYQVSQEEALKHGEVVKRLNRAITCLKEASAIFLDAICAAVDRLPYCLLYTARVLRDELQRKFPQAPEKDVLKVVGNLVYYRFINSAIVAPDAFDIVTLPPDLAMTPDQRRNLGSIAKILQFAASKKGFGEEAGHLQTLNPFIITAHERFKEFVRACCAVKEPEQYYGRDEFTEATLIVRPIIYITKQDLYDTHRLLVEHASAVAPDPADPLHEILEELGDQPSLDGGQGEEAEPPGSAERVEVCLTLQERDPPAEDDDTITAEKMFLQCKQMLVDVLRCTEDVDVAACARAEPTALQERSYRQLLQARGDTQRRRQPHQLMHRNNSFLAQPCATLEEAKDALLERLRALERAGRVDREDGYRALLDAVAADIVHQRRRRQQRRQELVKLRRTTSDLDQKRSHHQEQARYYTQYLATCLQGMAAGRRHKVTAKTAPLRYTAAKLKEKGVLLGIEGMQPNELKGVQFEIAPLAAEGVFQVNAKLLGVQLERVEISLQELLQLQYDGVSVLNMFGRVRVNVNLLIFLLNNKFYGKHKRK